MDVYTDPMTGRRYVVEPDTGDTRWVADDGLPVRAPSPYAEVAGHDTGSGDPYARWRSPLRPEPAPAPEPAPKEKPVPDRRGNARSGGGAGRTLKIVAGLAVMFAAFTLVASLLPDRDVTDATLADLATTPSPMSTAPVPSGAGSPASSGPAAATRAGTGAAPSGVGTPVRSGAFEFTVAGVRTAPTVGDDLVSTKARGRFVLVALTARNTGGEAAWFTASAQRLYDAVGHVFAVDAISAAYLGDDGANYLTEVAAGDAVRVTLVFDVPVTSTPGRVELRGGTTSAAATVTLAR